MLWMDLIADKIVEVYPGLENYRCQCGMSTTGEAHFGNYRELVIVYAVVRALRIRGLSAEAILSFDDFDRYKKLASNTPACYQQYIGHPNFSIPSPYSAHEGYAEYFENRILANLSRLQIGMTPVFQQELYRAGAYLEDLETALCRHEQVMQIINGMKTEGLNKQKQMRYPVSVYCERCGKDFTEVLDYDREKGLRYSCACGFSNTQRLDRLWVKGIFKLDWPMRWKREKIVFEPAGRSHMEPLGAYSVSSRISRELFDWEPPLPLLYQFVSVKGQHGRMSKTAGEPLTPEKALALWGRDMFVWILAHKAPGEEITVSTSDGVETLYAEYEAFLKSQKPDDLREKQILEIGESAYTVPFRCMLHELAAWGHDREALIAFKGWKDDLHTRDKLARVEYYLNNGYTGESFRIGELRYELLSDEEKSILARFFRDLCDADGRALDATGALAAVERDGLSKMALTKALALLLFGKDHGPPLRRLLLAYPISAYRTQILERLRVGEGEQ